MKNHKGTVPALLTLGLVLVGSLVTIGVSYLTNTNKIASNPKATCGAIQQLCSTVDLSYSVGYYYTSGGKYYSDSSCNNEIGVNPGVGNYCENLQSSGSLPPPSASCTADQITCDTGSRKGSTFSYSYSTAGACASGSSRNSNKCFGTQSNCTQYTWTEYENKTCGISPSVPPGISPKAGSCAATSSNEVPCPNLACCFYKNGKATVYAKAGARVNNDMSTPCTTAAYGNAYGAESWGYCNDDGSGYGGGGGGGGSDDSSDGNINKLCKKLKREDGIWQGDCNQGLTCDYKTGKCIAPAGGGKIGVTLSPAIAFTMNATKFPPSPTLPTVRKADDQTCVNRFQTINAYCGASPCIRKENVGGKVLDYVISSPKYSCGYVAGKEYSCCIRSDVNQNLNSAPTNRLLPTAIPNTGDAGDDRKCKDAFETEYAYCTWFPGCPLTGAVINGQTYKYIKQEYVCSVYIGSRDYKCCVAEPFINDITVLSDTISAEESATTSEGEEGAIINLPGSVEGFIENK